MGQDAITSRRNERVQYVRRLARDAAERRRHGLTLLEGLRASTDHVAAGGGVERLLVAESVAKDEAVRALVALVPESAVLRCSDAVLESVSDVSSPQGVVLVVPRPVAAQRFAAEGSPLLVLWETQDPANVGAAWRTAEGAGCAGLVLARAPGGALADPWSPRVLRASAGSALRLPAHEATCAPEELAASLAAWGFALAALVPRGGRAPEDAPLAGSVALLLGAEGQGLPDALVAAASLRVTIPLGGRVESLNVAAAAAVVAFETARQRRAAASRG